MSAKDRGRRTALYRFYDADEQLLYIGIAYDPNLRRHQHSKASWRDLVAKQVIEWHPTRDAAAEAERTAIAAELPLHNTQHHPVNGPARARRQGAPAAAPPASSKPKTLADLYEDRELSPQQVRRIVCLLGLAVPRREQGTADSTAA